MKTDKPEELSRLLADGMQRRTRGRLYEAFYDGFRDLAQEQPADDAVLLRMA